MLIYQRVTLKELMKNLVDLNKHRGLDDAPMALRQSQPGFKAEIAGISGSSNPYRLDVP